MKIDLQAAPVVENPLSFIRQSTPRLRATVETHQATLPAADFAEMIVTIRRLYDKYTAKLLEFKPGIDRASALHLMMDREMSVTALFPVSCGKGCSGCCHYEVEITQDEAAVLKAIVLGGHKIDHDRLSIQAARERRSPEWRKFGSRDNRCVFLDEAGACSVYDSRPASCRKHVVTTPVAACTTDGAAVAPVQVLLAEILLSAELSIEGTEFGSLSKMLLKSLADGAGRRNATPHMAGPTTTRSGLATRSAQ